MFAFALLAALAAASETVPRSEHPEPQLQRADWRTLNGTWEFAEGDDLSPEVVRTQAVFPDRITVPFCRESRLSGLARTGFVKNVGYRRSFELPPEWRGERVLLHVGACDWRTTVWVNGRPVGFHEGGNAPVVCEVTDALHAGANELRVHAFDDALGGLQQLGKQARTEQSEGIFYTRTTGIWQSVWLERVGRTYVKRLGIRAHELGASVEVVLDGAADGMVVEVEARANGKVQAVAVAPARSGVAVDLFPIEPQLWSVEDPHLYDLAVRLRRAEDMSIVDEVASYFGLCTREVAGTRFLVNGKPVFQRLVLDQGFYLDGVWTAPSDEALKRDIELSKAAGFNGARLHQKVFEPRFHYWADKLGYLTWGEGPSYGADYRNPGVDRVVLAEWAEIVQRDQNHPSLVGWCPFNETGPESGPLQNSVVALTRALDPTRPVLDTSGYVHSDPGRDVDDVHDYDQDPASFRARYAALGGLGELPGRYRGPALDRPFFVSEFGGIGWIPAGEDGWGYGNMPKNLEEWHQRYEGLTAALQDNPAMFGFCYTQLTDVEQEKNGIFRYDRAAKFDLARVREATAREAACERGERAPDPVAEAAWRVLVAAAVDDPAAPGWRALATDRPLAGFPATGFDPAALQPARPGFGAKDGFGAVIGTPWTTSELYLHREFEFDGAAPAAVLLVLHHDNEVALWLNGEPLFQRQGWNDAYAPFDVTERARALLRRGANRLHVHVHQDTGGQYFDCALLVR